MESYISFAWHYLFKQICDLAYPVESFSDGVVVIEVTHPTSPAIIAAELAEIAPQIIRELRDQFEINITALHFRQNRKVRKGQSKND